MNLTIGLVRPGTMGGQIGVFDEHANLVRSLTTQHYDDKVLGLSSNGNIGSVTYEEHDGRRWVRTYNLDTGNIIGNWRLPDNKPLKRPEPMVKELKQSVAPTTTEGSSGGGIIAAVILFALMVKFAEAHLVAVLVCTALAALVILAIRNTEL